MKGEFIIITDKKKFIDALNQLCKKNNTYIERGFIMNVKDYVDKSAEYCRNDIQATDHVANEYRCHRFKAPVTYEDYYAKRKNEREQSMRKPIKIKKVIYNNPATIVMWSDGTKTVVKCSERDTYDPEKGLVMAIAKKSFGNKGNYYKEIKYWLPEESEEQDIVTITTSSFEGLKEEILKAFSEVK